MAHKQAIWNGTNEVLVGQPVCFTGLTVQLELSVSVWQAASLPLPAPIAHQNLVEKSNRNLVQHGMMVQQGGTAHDNCFSFRSQLR